MGLGNNNTKNGNKGSSYDYELRHLRLLGAIRDAVAGGTIEIGDVVVNLGDIEQLLQGKLGSKEQGSAERITTASTSASADGLASVSFTNEGEVDITVGGATLRPEATFEWCAKVGNTLLPISYTVPAGGDLLILKTVII